MAHPYVYGIAIAVGVVACVFTFFRNKHKPHPPPPQRPRSPPGSRPPPAYEYPSKENQAVRKRNSQNNTKEDKREEKEVTSHRRYSPPPPYENIPSPGQQLVNARQENDIGHVSLNTDQPNRSDTAGFSGSPQYFDENNTLRENVPQVLDNSFSSSNANTCTTLSSSRTDSAVSSQNTQSLSYSGLSGSSLNGNNVLQENFTHILDEPLNPERSISLASSEHSASIEILSDCAESIADSETFEKLNLFSVNCARCSKPIDQEKPKETIPCKHFFHLQCITEHLRSSNNCPWCSSGVKSLNF